MFDVACLFLNQITTNQIMKTTLTYLSILTFSIFLIACGGGETAQEADSEKTENMEDSKAEESSDTKTISGTYALNTEESQLMWEGNMLKVGGVSLYGHNGTVEFAKGEIQLNNGNVVGGTLVVNMKTITPTDDNYGEDNTKEDLIGHLSSDDFFAISEHPTATYRITGGDSEVVKGQLTIRGNTNDEVLNDISMSEDENQIVFKGTMTIDRQKYNVAFEMPAEDKVLSDDLDFEFKVVLDKKKAA